MKKKPIFHSVSLVIPLYNNRATLESELNRCTKILEDMASTWEIVIIDDASTDGSKELLDSYAPHDNTFRIIHHKQNRGIGSTIRELYDLAAYDVVILYSVDGDWNTQDIQRMLACMVKTHADIMIGRRNKKAYSIYRRIVSWVYNALPVIFFGIDPIDAGSIKAFRRAVYKEMQIISHSIFFESEFIIRAGLGKYRIVDIPVCFHRTGRSAGSAGNIVNVVRSFWDLIQLYIRVRLAGAI